MVASSQLVADSVGSHTVCTYYILSVQYVYFCVCPFGLMYIMSTLQKYIANIVKSFNYVSLKKVNVWESYNARTTSIYNAGSGDQRPHNIACLPP